jgi:sialate O-acetylesterase
MKLIGRIVLLTMLSAAGYLGTSVLGDVRLPAVISDHMVLQRGQAVPIWGWADPQEKVTVTTSWQQRRWVIEADADGKWMVRIKTPAKGIGPFSMTFRGQNEIRIEDILIGEVWLCSGQSNMEFPVGVVEEVPWKSGVDNYMQEVAQANYPRIRFFTIAKQVAETPEEVCLGSWERCTPQSVIPFSAVAYFFGRDLHTELGKVPVGLIHSSWGGSPAEAWTSFAALMRDGDGKAYVNGWARAKLAFLKAKKEYPEKLKAWQEQAKEAVKEKKFAPPLPPEPKPPSVHHQPAGMFNGMIAPVAPFGIKGVIWYQGEANVSRAQEYHKLFGALIRNWRGVWGQQDLPFYYVQLANFIPNRSGSIDDTWALLREAQLQTLSLPKTGMAVTIDIGDPQDIYPKNKQDVGHRLALWALANTYGRKRTFSGPLFETMKIEQDKVRVQFRSLGGGLATPEGADIVGFTIAGADRNFFAANAEVRGKTLVVSSRHVPAPVAVRYAWGDNPVGNLYNRAGLPASPFRTDSWPVGTQKQP